jgi:hypothetical protein
VHANVNANNRSSDLLGPNFQRGLDPAHPKALPVHSHAKVSQHRQHLNLPNQILLRGETQKGFTQLVRRKRRDGQFEQRR